MLKRLAAHVQGKLGVAQEYAQGIVKSITGGAQGTSIYSFGNNHGNGENAPTATLPVTSQACNGPHHLSPLLQC